MSPQLPGISPERHASFRQVTLADPVYLPGGIVVDGSQSRDAEASVVTELQAGTPMGKLTSNGQYAPSVFGVINAAYDKDAVDGTELKLTVSVAVATEVLRRLGGVGVGKTIRVVGPETAAGVINEVVVQIDAVDTATGEITLNAVMANDFISGALLVANDGTASIRVLMPDGAAISVVDEDGTDSSVSVAKPLIGGLVEVSALKHYPSDVALQAWYKAQLNAYGRYLFSDDY